MIARGPRAPRRLGWPAPEWFLCGHIHEAEGLEVTIGLTRAVNVGKKGYLLELL